MSRRASWGVGGVAAFALDHEWCEQQARRELPTSLSPQETIHSEEISILGTKGLLPNVARCCTPAPGDPIVGYITRGRGVTIHRRDCPNVLEKREPERYIRVSWGKATQTYPVPIRISAYDRSGLLNDVTTVVAAERLNIASVAVNVKDSLATLEVVLEVADVEMLARVLARIEQLPNVIEARRWKAG